MTDRPGLDTPLFDVPFVVLDVETTGDAPQVGALTEIGAALFRGGECLGTFDTLVDPRQPVPPFITGLTGITDEMLRGAPPVASVLPHLRDFVSGSVVVGHNVSFDIGFIDAALTEHGLAPLDNASVCTLALARRLLGETVPNCTLSGLAGALGLEHRPAHRALADVLATADLLHRLIETAAGYRVACLGELLELPDTQHSAA